MATCTKCGNEFVDGSLFCPSCGALVGNTTVPPLAPESNQTQAEPAPQASAWQAPQPAPAPLPGTYPPPQNTAGQPPLYGTAPNGQAQPGYGYPAPEQDDVQTNKVMAILSYFGLLALIPWFAAPNSKFARFHAKEGIKLLLIEAAVSVVRYLINSLLFKTLLFPLTGYNPFISLLSGIISFAVGAVSLVAFVLSIMGIVNAANGEFKKVPLLDKIPLWDKFSFLQDDESANI
ncbi:MAG: zinc ribbon domain-containing protein [Oscillospiraceae bacterium]|jgi:uncharacterized membrane protein|nr:zinc ribbon domain-containing protein [Oscillospiraceae bacterium]